MEDSTFFISRKIFLHEVWATKPAEWFKIWVYIIGNVNHTKTAHLDRGEGFFNFASLCKQRVFGPNVDPSKIKRVLSWLRARKIIDTRPSTRGVIVKVIKYGDLQRLPVKKRTRQSTLREPVANPSRTLIHNKGNKGNEEEGKSSKKNSYNGQVKQIMDDFVRVTGRRTILNEQREKLITKRLDEGKTVRDFINVNYAFVSDIERWPDRANHLDPMYAWGTNGKTGQDYFEKWLSISKGETTWTL